MPRQPSSTLTDGEARLMKVLWIAGRATVAEIVAALAATKSLAYNTVQTMLGILERKGYVAHEQVGRAFVYWPLIKRGVARRRAVSHLVEGLFDNSPSLLILEVLRDDQLDPDEVERLKHLIEEGMAKAT